MNDGVVHRCSWLGDSIRVYLESTPLCRHKNSVGYG